MNETRIRPFVGMPGRLVAENQLPRLRCTLSRITWRTCVAAQLSDHKRGDSLDAPWPGHLILDVVHDDIA